MLVLIEENIRICFHRRLLLSYLTSKIVNWEGLRDLPVSHLILSLFTNKHWQNWNPSVFVVPTLAVEIFLFQLLKMASFESTIPANATSLICDLFLVKTSDGVSLIRTFLLMEKI